MVKEKNYRYYTYNAKKVFSTLNSIFSRKIQKNIENEDFTVLGRWAIRSNAILFIANLT